MESQNQSLMNQTLETQLLNPREQELLASIRKSQPSKSAITRLSTKGLSGQKKSNESGKKQSLIEQAEQEIKKNSNVKKLTKQSYKILVDKLERNLNEHLNEIDRDGLRALNFQQLGRLFTVLDIFRSVQYTADFELDMNSFQKDNQTQNKLDMHLHELAWKILTGDKQIQDSVDVRKVFCLFRILLDPDQSELEKQIQILKEYLIKIEPEVELDEQVLQDFCIEFRNQNKSRLAHVKIGYLKPNFAKELIEDYQNTLTFKPQLSEISLALQNVEMENTLKPSQRKLFSEYQNVLPEDSKLITSQSQTRVDQLMKKHERTQIKKQILQQKRDEEELAECTFVPQVNPKSAAMSMTKSAQERLYQFKSRSQLEQIEREAKEQKEMDELNECTFYPQLISSQTLPVVMDDVRNFDDTVQRMRRAIDQKILQSLKVNNIPRGDNYENVKKLPFAPPTMLQRDRKDRENPILQIKVNMGNGKMGRLSMRSNDDPHKVVKNFAKIWGLGQEEIQDLLERVEEEMLKLQDNIE